MASTQRYFQVVGQNLITIANMLLNNQDVCKLLYYTTKTPLSGATIVDTDFLMNQNIRMVPKIPDELGIKGSFIIILFDENTIDPNNEEVKLFELKFDVLCPIDEWLINESSLRPLLIMSEIQEMFDRYQIKGIGKLRFTGARMIVPSDVYAGYRMFFNNYEFN
jgi:hypothetical protein